MTIRHPIILIVLPVVFVAIAALSNIIAYVSIFLLIDRFMGPEIIRDTAPLSVASTVVASLPFGYLTGWLFRYAAPNNAILLAGLTSLAIPAIIISVISYIISSWVTVGWSQELYISDEYYIKIHTLNAIIYCLSTTSALMLGARRKAPPPPPTASPGAFP